MAEFAQQIRARFDSLFPGRRDDPTGRPVHGPIKRGAIKLEDGLYELRTRPAAMAALAALFVCAIIVFLIGRSLPSDSPKAQSADSSTAVSAGHLTLSGWPGWEQASAPAQVTALVSDPRVVTPAGTEVSVVFGDMPLERVPQMFSTLGLRASSGKELKAGGTTARLYDGQLSGAGGKAVAALLIPTKSAVSTAICLSDSGSASSADDCQTVLTTTASLRDADSVAASPAAAETSDLRSAISDLNSRRARDAATFTAATTSGRQANAAQALRADYAATAARVSKLDFSQLAGASGKELVAQLNRAAAAYGSVAKAADANSQTAYTAALDNALSAETKATASLKQLAALGYESAPQ